jgi:hypothetical protein
MVGGKGKKVKNEIEKELKITEAEIAVHWGEEEYIDPHKC